MSLEKLREKREQIQAELIEEEHPGWNAWTQAQYKQVMTNAIQRKIDRPDFLTESQLEQACIALGITSL